MSTQDRAGLVRAHVKRLYQIGPEFDSAILLAIAAADRGDWEERIELPQGGSQSALWFIEQFGLDRFVSPDGYPEEFRGDLEREREEEEPWGPDR